MSVKNKQHVELPDLTPIVSPLPPKKDSGFKIKFRSTCENQPEAFYLLIPIYKRIGGHDWVWRTDAFLGEGE